MSLKYRYQRINKITSAWKLKKLHPLITTYKISDSILRNFKINIKLYISKALNIKFNDSDKIFIKSIDKARHNRTNITPNGAVVPKREFHLEYNLVLRSWCELVREIIFHNPRLLRLFRVTPNIRIKFGKELSSNKKRSLSTSYPHSDAWVEGPWGMNCFIPFFGDTKKNNLIYSWNRVDPNLQNFGDGLIFCNKINLQNKEKNFDMLKSDKPRFLSNFFHFCLWNKLSVKTFNYLFLNYYNYLKKNVYKDNFNNVMFPFLGKEFYFSLFGNKGFFESQILIAYEKVESFVNDFKNLINFHKPIITLFSVKGMSGEHRYLRFEGNMICLTFDIVNNQKNLNFINELDKLYIKYDVVPSVIKDSRLKKEVFDKCYKFANEFREDLRKFDHKRSYRSELSDRLDL